MKRRVVLLCAAAAACGHNEPQLSAAADLQQLVETALAADLADAQTGKHKVCVQREFDTPLNETIERWQMSKNVSTEWYGEVALGGEMPRRLPPQIASRLERAVAKALAGRARVTWASAISSLPKPLILNASKSDQQSECEREMPHGLEAPKTNGPEEVSLTRPVFVDGFALIEYANACGGLCYGSSLRAFQRQNGKWINVGWTPLAVG